MSQFSVIYNRFLGKITDDMYMELTPQDTLRDLQHLLIAAIPGFEFPRVNLQDYEIKVEQVKEDEIVDTDFVLGVVWEDLPEPGEMPYVYVERSAFKAELTSEEIDILASLMLVGWLQRQVASIENTRMKYSGSDFKMTSQANHLAKLLTLLNKTEQQAHHKQRLYKRRKINEDGSYSSNWATLRFGVHGNY